MIQALSVSELVYEIKELLEGSYRNISCVGEISNLSYSSSGHYYFNVSDKDASISCALFKMDAFRNPLIRTLKNGDKVILNGPISLYAKRGTFQILVKKIVKSGQGTLLEQYRKLKMKLEQEGLFDIAHKKQIPKFIKKCVVITANKSAAMADFLNVYDRRSLMGELIVIPALVQGEHSEKSLIAAFTKANSLSDVDVIVFTRGGGSMEDLWSFNSEKLARLIAACETPIISAIGHQVDFTLCDYVSDLRVETPTAAAEKLTEKQIEIKDRLHTSKRTLVMMIENIINYYRQKVYNSSPVKNISRIHQSIEHLKQRLNRSNLKTQSSRLLRIENHMYDLGQMQRSLEENLSSNLGDYKQRLELSIRQLEGLNPKRVLERGYAMVKEGDKVISSSKNISSNKDLNIEFHDGTITVKKG